MRGIDYRQPQSAWSTQAKTLSGPLLALAALLPQPAWAGQAADAVGYFYAEGIGMEADESSRNRFTGPARAYLDASDRAFDEREEICLDFGLAVDGQDFDAAEVAQTLELEEAADGGAAIVVARFTNFGEPREIEWTLVEENGAWKVADIANETAGWRVSQFLCE